MKLNVEHNKIPNVNGYKDLGWQNSWKHVYFDKDNNITDIKENQVSFGYSESDYPEYGKCKRLKHQIRTFDNSLYENRGTDNVVICDECKILWHYDCSD